MTRLVILGAGGHGAVVGEAAVLSSQWESIGFLDDRLDNGSSIVGCPVLGKTMSLADFIDNHCQFFVAIGNNQRRDESLSSIEEQGGLLTNIVHPSAVVSASASIEPGTVICAGAVINARARIGRGSIVNTSASIDHDCELGRAVHVSPGAHLAGCVTVGGLSWIGIGAVIKDGVSIGSNCTVGSGAAVVADIESGQTVVGVPASPMRVK